MKKYFRFEEYGTNYRQEFMAGMTTFLAMAYILFVNPSTLALVGVEELPEGVTRIDQGAVFTATAIAAALGTLIMGALAKYPIALAPGMGLNAFSPIQSYLAMEYLGRPRWPGYWHPDLFYRINTDRP